MIFSQKKKMKRIIVFLVALSALLIPKPVDGQNMYVATNLLDYLNLGTINAEFGLSPWPEWTLYLKGRYCPFSHNLGGRLQNRVAGGAAGARYWFWYSHAGWFLDAHAGYSKYNTGGIFDSYAYEGDAFSIAAGGGYSLMLNRRWNLDFGLGLQAGHTSYVKYACPRCGKVVGRDKKIFVAPANVLVQLSLML